MLLSADQEKSYVDDGVLVVPDMFDAEEISLMKERYRKLSAQDDPSRVVEADGKTVRALHGSHMRDPLFESLTRDERLLLPAKQLLNAEVYVHQFKINSKVAFSGDRWPWHQDFIYWRSEDGIENPQLISACVFLDDVNEFNGPIMYVKGSHRFGVLDASIAEAAGPGYEGSPSWISGFTANMKYTVPQSALENLTREQQIFAPKGNRGSVVFFHPNVVHSSGVNLSPYDRSMLLITYNDVTNLPKKHKDARPDFLCGQNWDPLMPAKMAPLTAPE